MNLATYLRLVPKSENKWSYTFTPPVRSHGMVDTFTFIHIHTHTHVYTRMYVFMYACTYPCMYACMCLQKLTVPGFTLCVT